MEKLYKLTESVYVLPFNPDTDRPNLGYIKGEKGTVLFDCGTGPKTVNLLESELAENNLEMPEDVVISHFHWDHCFSSGYMDGKLHATQYTIDKMKQMAELDMKDIDELICDEFMPLFCKEHLHMEYDKASDIKLRVPDNVIEGTKIFDLGNVHVDIIEAVNQHCDGTVIGYVREDKVLFIGDGESGYIVDFDFYDEPIKKKAFYDLLKSIDFETIVLGHFKPMSRKEFFDTAAQNGNYQL